MNRPGSSRPTPYDGSFGPVPMTRKTGYASYRAASLGTDEPVPVLQQQIDENLQRIDENLRRVDTNLALIDLGFQQVEANVAQIKRLRDETSIFVQGIRSLGREIKTAQKIILIKNGRIHELESMSSDDELSPTMSYTNYMPYVGTSYLDMVLRGRLAGFEEVPSHAGEASGSEPHRVASPTEVNQELDTPDEQGQKRRRTRRTVKSDAGNTSEMVAVKTEQDVKIKVERM